MLNVLIAQILVIVLFVSQLSLLCSDCDFLSIVLGVLIVLCIDVSPCVF